MDMNSRSIPDLVAERKELARQQSDINARLEALDRALFARLETALAAFGVNSSAPSGVRPRLFADLTSGTSNIPPLPPPARPLTNQLVPETGIPIPPRASVGNEITNAAKEVLREAGQPMKIRPIFEALKKKGVEIPGKIPMNNLSAHLSRSSEFKLRPGYRWWFAEEQKAPD